EFVEVAMEGFQRLGARAPEAQAVTIAFAGPVAAAPHHATADVEGVSLQVEAQPQQGGEVNGQAQAGQDAGAAAADVDDPGFTFGQVDRPIADEQDLESTRLAAAADAGEAPPQLAV